MATLTEQMSHSQSQACLDSVDALARRHGLNLSAVLSLTAPETAPEEAAEAAVAAVQAAKEAGDAGALPTAVTPGEVDVAAVQVSMYTGCPSCGQALSTTPPQQWNA